MRLPSASFLLSLRLEFPCDLTNLFNSLSLAVCKRGLEKPRSPDLKSGLSPWSPPNCGGLGMTCAGSLTRDEAVRGAKANQL